MYSGFSDINTSQWLVGHYMTTVIILRTGSQYRECFFLAGTLLFDPKIRKYTVFCALSGHTDFAVYAV